MLLTYHSLEEVRKAPLPPHLRKVLSTCMQSLLNAYGPDYDPENDGCLLLYCEDTTSQDALDLFGTTWTDACLEGVVYDKEAKCFLTCLLMNNQFGYTIIVPDAPWLDPDFKTKLLSELVSLP